VLRVGGNGEEQAIDILHRANSVLAAPVEAYGRDDTPDFCVQRLRERVDSFVPVESAPVRDAPAPQEPYTFATVTGGTVILDHAACRDCESKACISTCAPGILSLDGDVPVLNISREDAKRGGCTECLACEVECYFLGNRGGRVILPVEGLEAYGDSD
jgi:ferredoxin-like protein FixX